MQLALGCYNQRTQEKLLTETVVDLDRFVQIMQADETAQASSAVIRHDSTIIAAANPPRSKSEPSDQRRTRRKSPPRTIHKPCLGCGQNTHCHKDRKCPAFNKTCTFCKRLHHFSSVCLKKHNNASVKYVTINTLKTPALRHRNPSNFVWWLHLRAYHRHGGHRVSRVHGSRMHRPHDGSLHLIYILPTRPFTTSMVQLYGTCTAFSVPTSFIMVSMFLQIFLSFQIHAHRLWAGTSWDCWISQCNVRLRQSTPSSSRSTWARTCPLTPLLDCTPTISIIFYWPLMLNPASLSFALSRWQSVTRSCPKFRPCSTVAFGHASTSPNGSTPWWSSTSETAVSASLATCHLSIVS